MKNIELLPDERLDYINEDLSLIQLKSGLTFGTDAYLLSAFVKKGSKGIDLGGGTGVASLLCLTKNKIDYMYAAEIQPRFAHISKRNALLNNLSHRMTVIEGDIRNLTEKDTGGCVDTVISNPPYMTAGGGAGNLSPEMNAARREINGTISDFCAAASRLLKYGGLFYTVYRADRLCDLFFSLRSNGLEPKKLVTVYPDTESAPCLVLCESKKGANPSLIHSRPLIIYKSGTRDYTEDMQKVYDTCSLSHLFK
ncbi:MAG: methyltransferase [Clostridia bacterium]|nr:methyltransferase [Clostridia bacterium]